MSACEAAAHPCGTDAFGDPPAGAIFVESGAVGGNGSRGAPFGSIEDALAAASAGSTIAISEGVHEVHSVVDKPLTLRGACTSRTTLRLSDATSGPALTLDSAGTTLTGFAIEGDGEILIRASADVELRGLELVNGRLEVVSGQTDVHRTTFRDLSDSDLPAIVVNTGARLSMQESALRHIASDAITVSGAGAVAEVMDTAFDYVGSGNPDTEVGHAVRVEEGATAELRSSLVQRYSYIAIRAADGAHLNLEQVAIREATEDRIGDSLSGCAVHVTTHGEVRMQDAWVSEARDEALRAYGAAATLDLRDTTIRRTAARRGTDGHAITGRLGAVIHGERVLMQGSAGKAVHLREAGESTLRDVIIEGSSVGGEEGLSIRLGSLTVTRARISNTRGSAVSVRPSAKATLTDLVVEDTRPNELGQQGFGLVVQAVSEATVTRARFSRNRETAVSVFGRANRLALTDVVIEEMASRFSDGMFGTSLLVSGGDATVERAAISASRGLGVLAAREANVELKHVTISDTLPQACHPTNCPETPFGYGLASLQASTISVDSFSIRGASLCGVLADSGGGIDLARGSVSESAIGVCLQEDGYDVGRLSSEVQYFDNLRNLQATSLPVPDATPPPLP